MGFKDRKEGTRMINLIIRGCNGKLGQVISEIAENDSEIKVVAASAKTFAAASASFASVFMPSDILAERRIATSLDACSTSASCSSENPVVQSTIAIFLSRQTLSSSVSPFGEEQSTTTSAETVHSPRCSNTG